MSLFAISAILLAVPFIAQRFGVRPAGMMAASGMIYLIYLATAYVATFMMPPEIGDRIMAALTGLPADATFATIPPYVVVAMGNTSLRATLVFATLAAVFWLLQRRSAPIHRKFTLGLFWTLALSCAAVFIYAGMLAIAPVPSPFEASLEAYAESPVHLPIAALILFQWASIAGFAAVIVSGIIRKVRHAL